MYRTYGNLAMKERPSAPCAPAPVRTPAAPVRRPSASPCRPARPVAEPSRPSAVRPASGCENETRRRCRTDRRRNVAGAVVLLVAFFGFATWILLRQARVMEASFAVSRTLRDAKACDLDTQVVEERIAAATDLTEIRRLAITRLGMQDPSILQRITVELPPSDRLLLSSEGRDGTGAAPEERDLLLREAMDDLEGFFRTLR